MVNPANALLNDTLNTIRIVFIAIIFIIILGTFGTALGMTTFTDKIILGISSGIFLVLAIPSIGMFIALFVLIIKIVESSKSESNLGFSYS